MSAVHHIPEGRGGAGMGEVGASLKLTRLRLGSPEKLTLRRLDMLVLRGLLGPSMEMRRKVCSACRARAEASSCTYAKLRVLSCVC